MSSNTNSGSPSPRNVPAPLHCAPPGASLPPGLLAELLTRSYQAVIEAEPTTWGWLADSFRRFDAEVQAHPETIGRCILLSRLGPEPVGFMSWDPRGRPHKALIGHNCIVPEHRGHGYGGAQLRAAIALLYRQGFGEIEVSTSEHPFFAPARRMYETCGFVENARRPQGPDASYRIVYFAHKRQ